MTATEHADVALFDLDDLVPVIDLTGWKRNILAEQEQASTHAGIIGLFEQRAALIARIQDDVRTGQGRMPDGVTTWDLRAGAYAWAPAVCGPNGRHQTDQHEHWPQILDVDLRCRVDGHRSCECVGGLIYRATCTVCGWVGSGTADENGAVESYHDHAFGRRWRIAPVMTRSWTGEKNDKAWVETASRLYGQDWIERAGPVWTARSRYGGRHVANRTPWGGYDLGVVVADHWRAPEHRKAPLEFNPAMVTQEMR